MRREGFEFQVSRPEVIYKRIDDVLSEPIEHVIIDVPDEFVGVVIENLGRRKGEMKNMMSISGNTRLEFFVPARGLIGFRGEFMTQTKGTGILHHNFHGYEPYKGEMAHRTKGALVAMETGEAVAYGMWKLQERSTFFIAPGTKVYSGMIVGENSRDQDMTVNVCKTKQLTNMRASGSDEAVRLEPPAHHDAGTGDRMDRRRRTGRGDARKVFVSARSTSMPTTGTRSPRSGRTSNLNHQHHNNSPYSKNLKEPTSAWPHEKSPTHGLLDSSMNCMFWRSISGGPGIRQRNRCSMNSLPSSGNTATTIPWR